MTAPVGLTRAEEERERQQPEARSVVKAPPGVAACRVGRAVAGIDCEAAATCRIVWPDDDVTPACDDCAQQARMQAGTYHKTLRIEPLR